VVLAASERSKSDSPTGMAEGEVEPLPDANANADDPDFPDFTSISRRDFGIVTDNRERMQAWSGEREKEK
jgi:hypothetical protein